jgi:DNA-directed RNA polymerase subunit RPC12/RpoP
MYCKKCGGQVYHDAMYDNDSFVDISCLMCGKRWFVKKSSPFARVFIYGERR